MPKHAAGLLDTSCVIDLPRHVTESFESFAVSTITLGELSYGLFHHDPVESARRESLYRTVLTEFTVIPYSQRAAHLYGAIAETVRRSGRNPRSRRIDLMVASVAAELGAVLLTRTPNDFQGLDGVVEVVSV